MAIVSKLTQRFEIPHEAGESMEFKRLSWRELQQARQARTDAVFANLKAMGGDVLTAMRSAEAQREEIEAEAPRRSTPADYDAATVLRLGIAGWSYPDKVTAQNIDGLDEETAEWAFLAIMRFNNIYPASEPAEDSRKND